MSLLPTGSALDALRQQYLQSIADWQEPVSAVQSMYGELIKKSWDQAAYVTRISPFDKTKMIVCPPHSMLNMAPNQQHRGDYGTGIFEGSSAEPTVDGAGVVSGLSVVLHEPRMARFARSMQTRGFELPGGLANFAQATLDIVAIHGTRVATNDDGTPTRAYIRPAAGPAVGRWGIAFKAGYAVEGSSIVFRWGHYLPDVERVYYGTGARAVINGQQRLFKIRGKHASNYGSAAIDGNVARVMKYDELLYLAPYGLREEELDYGIHEVEDLMRYGVLADGPGEEIFGVLADGSTLVYPPMRVNRLGGTVLQYIIDYMAPALGLETLEMDITLEDLRGGKIVGLAYAGNAARVAPIGQVDLVRVDRDESGELLETVVDFGIHATIARVRDQWEKELRGTAAPSHTSLLTPVDLAWGEGFRASLDDFWSKQGLPPLTL